MHAQQLCQRRLANLGLSTRRATTVAKVVRQLGALQAQDYEGALWAIGLRTGLTRAEVVTAIGQRQLTRTWPMRGTIHCMPSADAGWMCALTAQRLTSASALASHWRQLGLNEAQVDQAAIVATTVLDNSAGLGRPALLQAWQHAGIDVGEQRGNHLIRLFGMRGLLCFGEMDGKQPIYVRLDRWTAQRQLTHDEALATLLHRFVSSHGPVTAKDCARWASLPLTVVRRVLAADEQLESTTEDAAEWWQSRASLNETPAEAPAALLLPGFDEYMLGYGDRSAALPAEYAARVVPGNNGMFKATMVYNGQVIGTWKRTLRAKQASISLEPFSRLTTAQRQTFQEPAEAYGQFLNLPVAVE